MTDTAGDKPPFPGLPGFPPAEMLDKMWGMMGMNPFGAAFPGIQPGAAQGFGAPLAAMSDLMKPLMNVEELDKRITDMRAVEQWLKLNLSMLQSAIQALEVQRATLSTLSAFGAFAQASMTQQAEPASGQTKPSSAWSASKSTAPGRSSDASDAEAASAESAGDAQGTGAQAGATGGAAFDPSAWWNLLQSQFNQLAAFAMTQPDAAGKKNGDEADAKTASPKEASASGAKASADSAASASKPSAKRAPPRRSGGKPAPGSGGDERGEK